MITKIFAVFDSKAEAFMQPFFMQTTGHASRAFEDTANDPKSLINKHPGDFTLFEMGTFNDNTGEYTILPTPINLGIAVTYQRQDPLDLPDMLQEQAS